YKIIIREKGDVVMSTEISVAKGLSELKVLESRIYRAISDAKFGAIKVGNKLSDGFKTVEEVGKDAKASLDSINDLIKRRNAIKSAIVESNAKTTVDVAGVKYTVAGAIERKTAIDYERHLLATMRSQYSQLLTTEERTNEQVKERLDKQLNSLFGKDGDKEDEVAKRYSESFKKDNEATIVDPIGLKKKIEELATSIEEFESNVDFALNESNVLTKITIE